MKFQGITNPAQKQMKNYLNQQAEKLRDSAEGLVKKEEEFIGGEKRGSVKTETEAEKQAYQEEKRKHSGG